MLQFYKRTNCLKFMSKKIFEILLHHFILNGIYQIENTNLFDETNKSCSILKQIDH